MSPLREPSRLREPSAAAGIALAIAIGAVFTVLRASRYDLAIASGFSEFPLQIQLLRFPALVTDPYLRESVMAMMPPAARALATLANTFGMDVVGIEYVRLLLINVVACVSVVALARALFEDSLTAIVSVAVVVGGGLGYFGLGWYWTLGNWAEWHPLATGLGIGVLAALYRARYRIAGALIGTLVWVHPSHAAIMALLVIVAVMVDARARWRTGFDAAVIGAAIAAPAVWQTVPRLSLLTTSSAADLDAWWSLMRARKGHHLFPFSWSIRTWAAAGTLVVGGLVARRVVRRYGATEDVAENRERLTTAFLVSLTMVCVLGIVFSEIVPNVLVTKLGLLRASSYLEILLAMYVCRLVVHLLLLGPAAAVVGLALATGAVWIDIASRPGRAVLIVAPLLAWLWFPTPTAAALSGRKTGVAVAVLMLAVIPHVWLQALPSTALAASHPIALARAWKDVQEWARDRTAPGTTFVTPPNWCGFESFSGRLGSLSICDVGRSVYATRWAAEEIRRMSVYRTARDGDAVIPSAFMEGWPTRPGGLTESYLVGIAAGMSAQYAVVLQPTQLTLPRAYENAGFVVLRLEGVARR